MVTNTHSGTNVHEIAPNTYRISTPLDIPAIPGGFTINQYLIVDDEPLLFHTGLRRTFPLVAEAISKVIPVENLRHVGFSHFEADECGALNDFLLAAPHAMPLSSEIGALTSVNDWAERPGLGMQDGQELSIGSRTLQWIYTPHIPHGWDCGILFDKTNRTLLCGDLFTQPGSKCDPVTEENILLPAEQFRAPMDYFAHGRGTNEILLKLAALEPTTLAVMHGSAYRGDGGAMIRALAAALAK